MRMGGLPGCETVEMVSGSPCSARLPVALSVTSGYACRPVTATPKRVLRATERSDEYQVIHPANTAGINIAQRYQGILDAEPCERRV